MYMGKYNQLGKNGFVKFFNLVTAVAFILNLVGAKLDSKSVILLSNLYVPVTIKFLFSCGERQAISKYIICQV